MKLKEIVAVNNRFQNSINLILDQGNEEIVKQYIPTRASIEIMKSYLSDIYGGMRVKSSCLIGPYGKGKSHLLLVMTYILQNPKSKLTKEVLNKIKKTNSESGELLEAYCAEGNRYLPVMIAFGHEALEQSYRKAILRSLKINELEYLVPDSEYDEAEKMIQKWEKEFPLVYKKFEEMVKMDGNSFIEELHHKKGLELFKRIYPELTAGNEFQPLMQTDVVKLYSDILIQLQRETEYKGIVLVFDEFSKFMEGQKKETVSLDMKLVQDMCELGNKNHLVQIFVAHKSIKGYSGYLPAEVINTFTGVEGRMKEIQFVTTEKNNYELIQNIIEKKETFKKVSLAFDEMASKNYGTASFEKNFTLKEFQKQVVEGCYPMTPLSTFLLLKVSEKIGQNERSLVTFLAGQEDYTLGKYIAEADNEKELLTPDYIYDYFSPILKRDLYDARTHSEWQKTEMALQQVQSELERKILKTICLFRIVGLAEKIVADEFSIAQALMCSQEVASEALRELVKKEILLYRDKIHSYVIRQQIDMNIESELQQIENEMTSYNLEKELLDFMGSPYELPRRYNSEYEMTRYFAYSYMYAQDFIDARSKDIDNLDDSFSDGKILRIIDNKQKFEKEIKEKVSELAMPKLLVVYPKIAFQGESLAKHLTAIKMLMKKQTILNGDQVLMDELAVWEEDFSYRLHWMLEECYSVEKGKAKVFSCVEITGNSLNEAVSQVCENCYGNAPRINHEMVNRRLVSAQIRKARGIVVDSLLSKADVSEWSKGTSAEATIYRATIKNSIDDSEELKNVIKLIKKFALKSDGKKQNFKILYEKLQGEGIGMREGTIPIYLAYVIAQLEGTAIVYSGNQELFLNHKVLDAVNDNPSQYDLFIEKGTKQKEMYLKAMHEIFCKDSQEKKERILQIAEEMQMWYLRLPVCARMAEYKKDVGVKFGKAMSKHPLNPRFLLFENLPEIIDSDLDKLPTELLEMKQFLENYQDELYKKIIKITKQKFSCEKDSLRPALKNWYSKNIKMIQTKVMSSKADQLINYIKEFEESIEEKIIADISKILTGFYPEDWHMNTCDIYENVLEQVLAEMVEDKAIDKEGMCHFSYTDSKGNTIEKYMEEVEEDSVFDFTTAAIESAIDEFGDSLEKEQKIAACLSVLESLLKN